MEIENDIPLPEVKGGGPRTEMGKALAGMEPGQSFLTRTNRATIYSLARYYGITVSVRADGDQLRVWRLEEQPTTKGEKDNAAKN